MLSWVCQALSSLGLGQDDPMYVAAAMALAFLVGIIFMGMGLLRYDDRERER
jgi:hypothetical protein